MRFDFVEILHQKFVLIPKKFNVELKIIECLQQRMPTISLVSLLISTGLNLLYSPFTEVARKDNGVLKNDENSEGDLSVFPFNILKDTPACTTITVKLGENQLKLTTIPRGFCTNCCPVKIARDIQFILFNKNISRSGVRILPFNERGAARRAGVNPEWKTVIFIHGFTEPSPGESGRTILEAYLSRPENHNIILLDWGELACFPWYRTAVQNVKFVGQVLRNFIKLYNKTGELPVQKIHLIGFSLGSHIASMAGKGLQGSLKIPRITALDPAFPEFPLEDRTKRLAETDADYIDVIHTDSGILGFPVSIGHADFYPNGGRALQPGCQPSYLAQQMLIDQVLACGHVRAWRLYAESVKNPEAFPATRCQKWRGPSKECDFTVDAYMGFRNRNSSGQFFLRTGFKSPYSLSIDQQQTS